MSELRAILEHVDGDAEVHVMQTMAPCSHIGRVRLDRSRVEKFSLGRYRAGGRIPGHVVIDVSKSECWVEPEEPVEVIGRFRREDELEEQLTGLRDRYSVERWEQRRQA